MNNCINTELLLHPHAFDIVPKKEGKGTQLNSRIESRPVWLREREWTYDCESHIGLLRTAFDEALKRGRGVVDMKRDWKLIFPIQK